MRVFLALVFLCACSKQIPQESQTDAQATMICFAGKADGGKEFLFCSSDPTLCGSVQTEVKARAETISACKLATVSVALQE